MKPVYYRPFKLAVTALMMGASAIYLLTSDGSALNMVLGVIAGIGAVAAGACGIDPRPALRLDGKSLFVRTTLRRRLVPLADILTISVQSRMVRLQGVIPIGRREVLVIRAPGGMFGSQKFTLVGGTLALPAGGLREICTTLNSLRRSPSAVPELSSSHALASDGEGGSGFDADAAIARYLARKAAEPALAAQDAAAAVSAAPPARTPVRKSFGRRVA